MTAYVPIYTKNVRCGRGLGAKNVQNFEKLDTYNPLRSIRISARNFGEENSIIAVPLYAVCYLQKV
jgi:hypothetical protein